MSIRPRQLLRISDARARLGNISRSSFYRLARSDDRFPRLLRVGGISCIDADALDCYIAHLADPEAAE